MSIANSGSVGRGKAFAKGQSSANKGQAVRVEVRLERTDAGTVQAKRAKVVPIFVSASLAGSD
jgi:hypothetical protein